MPAIAENGLRQVYMLPSAFGIDKKIQGIFGADVFFVRHPVVSPVTIKRKFIHAKHRNDARAMSFNYARPPSKWTLSFHPSSSIICSKYNLYRMYW